MTMVTSLSSVQPRAGDDSFGTRRKCHTRRRRTSRYHDSGAIVGSKVLAVMIGLCTIPWSESFSGWHQSTSLATLNPSRTRLAFHQHNGIAPRTPSSHFSRHDKHLCGGGIPPGAGAGSTTTELNMVFDFFKQRASEGVAELSKLTDSVQKGQLSEGLTNIAVYTQTANAAFAKGLAKSRTKLLYDVDALLNNRGVDVLEELETILLQADLGLATTEDILVEVKSLREDGDKFFSKEDLMSILRGKLLEALDAPASSSDDDEEAALASAERQRIQFANPDGRSPEEKLTVLFFMGANGMGKTTTVGKIAHRLRTEGEQKVLLAACDTFRAGAVDQLVLWGDRAEVDTFVPTETAKTPSAVLYGALDKALAGEYDTLIVDTSGRLANNDALTRELAKMKTVIQKRLVPPPAEDTDDGQQVVALNVDVPHETLLVIDAAQGRMALDSARQWHQEIGLSGLILTKLDGSAKGGSVVAVSRELGLPVKLVGVGEGIDDLKDFNPEQFVDGLLGIGEAGGATKGGKKSNEGKELANRLKDMRKARDDRARETAAASAAKKKGPGGLGSGGGGRGGMLDMSNMDAEIAAASSESDSDLVGAVSPSGTRKPSRKSRKKKKKKGRR